MDSHKRGCVGSGPCPVLQPHACSHTLASLAQGLTIPQALSSSAMIICIHSDGQIQQSFRIRSRSHVVHVFIDSTHVPGMRLDTENPAGTMGLKLTFPHEPLLPLSISEPGWTPFVHSASPNGLCLFVS